MTVKTAQTRMNTILFRFQNNLDMVFYNRNTLSKLPRLTALNRLYLNGFGSS